MLKIAYAWGIRVFASHGHQTRNSRLWSFMLHYVDIMFLDSTSFENNIHWKSLRYSQKSVKHTGLLDNDEKWTLNETNTAIFHVNS